MSHYQLVRALIENARPGTYGSVVFRKKDGTFRRLVYQRGNDAAYISGTERGERARATFARDNPHMLRLRDVHVAKRDGMHKAWRTVDLTKVVSVRCNGAIFRIIT